ncbi:hypothetical protein A4R28_33170 (plasmid) [Mesorhizobium ciceri]|nr:hypothetical protein A4R28_33170 [Mesorhizobium ciceri]
MVQFLSECLVVGSDLWIAAQHAIESLEYLSAPLWRHRLSTTRTISALFDDAQAPGAVLKARGFDRSTGFEGECVWTRVSDYVHGHDFRSAV